MTDELRTKIANEVDETSWAPLALHAKRDALFLVDRSLALVDVAYAIATNRGTVIALWIDAGLLRRPSAEERATLETEPEAVRFRFAIVQPYVLAQRVDQEN